jgi:cyclopropane fatty-acyl-phospholipid synthase-like methyltransferase
MSGIDHLYDEIRAYKRSRIMATAIHLGILSALKRHGPVSLAKLSADLSLVPDWLTAILRILCRQGFVTVKGQSYSLTEVGHEAESDSTLRAFSGYHFHCFDSWMCLPQAMFSKKGNNFHRQRIRDKDFCRAYLMSMAAIAESHAEFVEQECGSLLKGAILDIGAGPSYLCRRLAHSDASVTITALDFEEIVLSAKELYGEPENLQWIAGDFFHWEASGQFDAAHLGHVLEYCPKDELAIWLRRIRSFIKDEGYLILVVFLRDENSEAAEDLDLFEISTGLNGANLGHISTTTQITDELQHAGFRNIEVKMIPEGPSYSEYLVTCQASPCEEAQQT